MAATDSILNETTIRRESKEDFEQISTLLDEAFGGHYEAQLVSRIRKTTDYIGELTLVAVKEDRIVGFIMISYVGLRQEECSHPVLSLAPLAVASQFQKSGIGGALIREAIKLSEERKEPLIVLLGHAEYYPRFGFQRASAFGIQPPVAWPDASFMILPLTSFNPTLKGTVHYSPAWRIE